MKRFFSKYIGDRHFYARTLRIALPLSLQMLLQSCMGIIDTMMVSRIGMVTAVGTAVQIDTLANLITYGISSGIGMFAAQFFGAKQLNSLKKSFGLGLMLSAANGFFWFLVALFFGKVILSFYMGDPTIVEHSYSYLQISMFALVPLAINNVFGSMYRSTQQAKFILFISTIGASSNVFFNALFIFGFGPIPAMGVQGAALGTLLGQLIILTTYIIYSIKTKQPFIGSLKEMFTFDLDFAKPILIKMMPLIINEGLFGFGMTLFVKAFGVLGTQSMDAYYVANQIYNVFLFVVYGYGAAIAVLIGTRLGEGRIEQAINEQRYYLGLSGVLSFVLVSLILIFSGNMVALFGLTDPVVFGLAKSILYVLAIKASMRLFNFMIFSILRAGGDAKIIQFLDSGIMYFIGLPIAFGCVYLLGWESIVLVVLATQIEQLVRLICGLRRLTQRYWAKDLTKLVA